ncbi:MAG: PAS domain-containing protein [Thermoanaerobaculaceae bacterium]|nr:PAS domain-containing protein [Thermoanaerobaculaceae bacterium]
MGRTARLPVRLRLLGEPTVVAEPGVDEVRIWWRVPVLDRGRQLGALLASAALPESGARRALGVWAGRAAAIVPLLDGGEVVSGPGGVRVVGLGVAPGRAVWWSTPGFAVAGVLLLLGAMAAFPWRGVAVAAALAWLVALGGLPEAFGAVLFVGAAVGVLAHLRHARWARLVAGGVAGGVAFLLPWVLVKLSAPTQVDSLLAPGLLSVALVGSLAALCSTVPGGQPRLWVWVVRLGGWSLVVLGLLRTHPLALAVGVASLVGIGTVKRSVAAGSLLAAAVLMTAWDTVERQSLAASTDATLALLQNAEKPARAYLASLPQSGLATLLRFTREESLVVLGRHAHWSGLQERLPGTCLVLRDASGGTVTAWGPLPPPGSPVRVLAEKELESGGSLAVVAPASPLDGLESLTASGVGAPVAAFDRSGAPRGRGATFKPLPPEVVGRALAAGRSWVRLGVGEREFLAYLRVWGDTVLAVPWVRPPAPERALILAGLALWGGLPLAAWRERGRAREWWRERNTFVGRTRILTAATTLVPVVLLGQLLPVQWLRQQQRWRLEFGRAVAAPLVQLGWEPRVAWLAHEMGGAAGLYRGGRLVASSRPDLVVRGGMPALPPRTAYVRAIRGWGEPVVEGEEALRVFVAAAGEPQPTVLGVVGIPAAAVLGGSSPREWFAVTGVLSLLAALVAAEKLGQRLSTPLRTVVRAAERLGRGEPLGHLPVASDADVAALGQAFATMAETVQRREDDLRRERDLLETVLSTLSAGVVVVAPNGEVELANPSARTLLDGRHSLGALAERFGSAVKELLEGGAAGTPGERMVHPPGQPESVWRVTVRPLRRPSGRVLVVLEDLSEFARAERLASLAELARIVAHEVKNPLTPIRLWAEELKETLARDPQAVVETARLATEQILERVEHLREVTQGFSNLVALERWSPQRVNLTGLARQVAGEYGVLSQRGVVLLVEATREVEVVADPEWLRRALRHLLENSARALSGRGGPILVQVREEGSRVVLTVRDTGGGVAEEHLPRLFEPFFSTTSDGSGLGLSVVRRVAERAGGTAEARNAGGGLEVRLEFPHPDPPLPDGSQEG